MRWSIMAAAVLGAALMGPPVAEAQLIRDLSVPAGPVGPDLVDLELDGKIRRQSGGLLSLGN